MALVCQLCAKERASWSENCPHVAEVWREGYRRALRERPQPRLTSDDVRDAMRELPPSLPNFYLLAADALNRILDEKDAKQPPRNFASQARIP
jgi:hypothetical protein